MFSREELAFFAVPRTWIPWIVARFGDDSDVRDAIIHSDTDGGLGFLFWMKAKQSWVLSDKGKRWVGNRALMKGARWELPPPPPVAPEKPKSFLCPVCEAKSLGADRCLACEPPVEAANADVPVEEGES